MPKIRRALLSVYDKNGLVAFARVLADAGIELVSTGGTARVLRDEGLSVRDVSELTGFPEMLDGRVKTLHPKVHGGLLHRRDSSEHLSAIKEHQIPAIDLVVVNLYPFQATIARAGVTRAEAIENIDIGGPAMLRSAAKNHESVAVVTDPADYDRVAEQVINDGETSAALRRQLAVKVFAVTSRYDRAITDYLRSAESQSAEASGVPAALVPEVLCIEEPMAQQLRYGENPHQRAALYGSFTDQYQQLHGKALSYNNILDLTAAAALIGEFGEGQATLAILKHTNPCGVGQGDDLKTAWEKALATDRQAPFGGIIAVNRSLDLACAQAISEIFSEVIIAPSFCSDAFALLSKKKNLRLIRRLSTEVSTPAVDIRGVGAGLFLWQERDVKLAARGELKVVTQREPTAEEWQAMLFGWKVIRHIKSNAILYAGPERTLGIGAGQMSRVDASRIAVWKAGEAGLELKGSAVCSDAFFPFADGPKLLIDAGVQCIVQPGGSVRDQETIDLCAERNITLLHTGTRRFRH